MLVILKLIIIFLLAQFLLKKFDRPKLAAIVYTLLIVFVGYFYHVHSIGLVFGGLMSYAFAYIYFSVLSQAKAEPKWFFIAGGLLLSLI